MQLSCLQSLLYDLNHTFDHSLIVLLSKQKTMSVYMNNSGEGNDATVAQLAISHPAALGVFEKYNIDYCCGGHYSLEEACHKI